MQVTMLWCCWCVFGCWCAERNDPNISCWQLEYLQFDIDQWRHRSTLWDWCKNDAANTATVGDLEVQSLLALVCGCCCCCCWRVLPFPFFDWIDRIRRCHPAWQCPFCRNSLQNCRPEHKDTAWTRTLCLHRSINRRVTTVYAETRARRRLAWRFHPGTTNWFWNRAHTTAVKLRPKVWWKIQKYKNVNKWWE